VSNKFLAVLILSVVFGVNAAKGRADWVRSFTGSDSGRSAEVRFTYEASADKLIIDLTNTDQDSPLVAGPGDNLTAMFFSADFVLNASSGTAYVPTLGSVIQADASGNIASWSDWPSSGPPERSVGTEWAYKSGLAGVPGGATQGLSSAGLNLFGAENRFETSYADDLLSPPASVDGENFGIVPAGTSTVSGSLKNRALIRNSTQFTFTGVGDLSGAADSIGAVEFLYGTALDGPLLVVVPEPSTLVLLGMAGLGMLTYARSRRGS
jgi:hypothetical protein